MSVWKSILYCLQIISYSVQTTNQIFAPHHMFFNSFKSHPMFKPPKPVFNYSQVSGSNDRDIIVGFSKVTNLLI